MNGHRKSFPRNATTAPAVPCGCAALRATGGKPACAGPGSPRFSAFLGGEVLFRDRAAITDLVATVLAPLQHTRGGPQPLLDTLSVYFAAGSATGAANRMHLSVRALTYRLQRVHTLTGYDPTDSTHRHTLHTAVLGARLLNWPTEALPTPG